MHPFGRPCCSTYEQAKAKFVRAIYYLLLAVLPVLICLARWLTSYPNLSFFLLGNSVHNLFPDAWVYAFAKDVEGRRMRLGLPETIEEDQDEDRATAEGDSFVIRMTKRMGRSLGFWRHRDTNFVFMFTMLILRPCFLLLCVVMKESGQPFSLEPNVGMSDLIEAIGRCQAVYLEMLQAPLITNGEWRLLRGIADFEKQETKMTMRAEVIRMTTSVQNKTVAPLRSGPLPLLIAAESVPDPDNMDETDEQHMEHTAALLCEKRGCCRNVGAKRLLKWAGGNVHAFKRPRKVKVMKVASKKWRSNTINVERKHSGGKRRAKKYANGKARGLRRQVELPLPQT